MFRTRVGFCQRGIASMIAGVAGDRFCIPVWQHRISWTIAFVAAAGMAFILASCSTPPAPGTSAVIHLIDVFKRGCIESTQPSSGPAVRARYEWRFDGSTPTTQPAKNCGWQAGPDVADLAVEEKRLIGRSTGEYSLITVERESAGDDNDLLVCVEVRMRASAGANMAVAFVGAEGTDNATVQRNMRNFPGMVKSTPILAGAEFQTYVIPNPYTIRGSDIRRVALRPTDVAGAKFEIESVRLVFHKERLAETASGVGYEGMSEVYRECLVSRVPEVLRIDVTLPARPWLDIAFGTPEAGPIMFHVEVKPQSGGSTVRFDRTVTRAYQWDAAAIDLSGLAEQRATITLSLGGAPPGTLGFWGSLVIRSHADGAAGKSPRGVILVWADTLRRDHLDVYGYKRETSPNLRRMAAEGTQFRDCLTQATWTKVSTPSLMTGLYPATHGVRDFLDRLPAAATTLAERMRAGGHATLSMSSILFTGKFSNLHKGFEEVYESGSLPKELHSKTAREYVDRLGPWLERHRDTPFFVFLHVADPHDPYEPYPPYDMRWADAAAKASHERDAKRVRDVIEDPLMKLFGMPTRAEMVRAGVDPDEYCRREQAWYDGSIAGLDAEMGRLIERLRMLGLDKQTLVVFTADHGEEFLEHGRMFHGQSVYGELNQVPLVFWWPGVIPAGRTVEETVQTIDIMPTILEFCGAPVPPGVQGRSLLPLACPDRASRNWTSRPAFTQKAITRVGSGGPPPHETESLAIVKEGWKLIHNRRRGDGRPEFELYDARRDSLDQIDLAAKEPGRVQQLAKELAGWDRAATAARLKPGPSGKEKMDAADLDRLRRLGYLN